MAQRFRIATFNLENLDDKPDQQPSLATRIAILRPQLLRVNADVLCLQEVHSQTQGNTRVLAALTQLLQGTPYAGYNLASTRTEQTQTFYQVRNIVTLSHLPIVAARQLKNDQVPAPEYRRVTALPREERADRVTWERPILHVTLQMEDGAALEVINVHLKSKNPTDVPGQKLDQFTWRTISGWAEGFFLSAMKRVGQALEVRTLIDQLFEQNLQARIVACGDFNADIDDVPMEAIRGDVENTGNKDLALRNMIPCERTIPEPARFSLYHQGRKNMLDHILLSRALLPFYRNSEIHNEVLHDESIAFADDRKYPESDHAPVVSEFSF